MTRTRDVRSVVLLVSGAWRRRVALVVSLAWTFSWLAAAVVAQEAAPSNAKPSGERAALSDLEAAGQTAAPVVLDGETVIWITSGLGPYTPQFRAERISRRLDEAVHDRGLADPRVTVTEADGSSELRAGTRLLMVVTERDARDLGVARTLLAERCAATFEAAIRAARLRYAPSTLILSAALALLATLLLLATAWLVRRLTRVLHGVIERWRARRLASVRLQQVEIVSGDHIKKALERVVVTVRVVLLLLALDVYLTFVLGLFPWTRALSFQLLDYVVTPIRAAGSAFIGYLPNLLFLVVIAVLIYAAIRTVSLFFQQVQDGRVVFAGFPSEWADPTNKIVRVLLIAFGVVVAFPYLPASSSPAFAGVSVFIGVLVSLASGSSLSNMIAGLVLTYTRAFRVGDRVKIGDAFGDIVETSLLATHVRTIKNEEVTIPNSLVLSTAVTNYSRAAPTLGLILHTSVTIGYDAPWRTVHDLLVQAAVGTAGVLADPAPFVWQTALNDFYVTYEINAYTASPREMPDIYARLHARIQDAFFAAGVEIMSPHYTSLRDGNVVAMPPSFRGKDYRAPAFRVESTGRGEGVEG